MGHEALVAAPIVTLTQPRPSDLLELRVDDVIAAVQPGIGSRPGTLSPHSRTPPCGVVASGADGPAVEAWGLADPAP
jgi:hypothetical protein